MATRRFRAAQVNHNGEIDTDPDHLPPPLDQLEPDAIEPLGCAPTPAQVANGEAERLQPPRRALVLTGGVGEGHTAAAHALEKQLQLLDPSLEIEHYDGLEHLGAGIHHFSVKGHRTTILFMPWMYSAFYRFFTTFPPASALGNWFFYRVGYPHLRKLIEQVQPDVVASTHPVVTTVLGEARRRDALELPVYAAITDLSGMAFWAHRGVDLHFVVYEESVPAAEKRAKHGTVRVVRPLVDPVYLNPPSKAEARAALDLDPDGGVVVISGGGWGIGDLDGATSAALELPVANVICLSGRNEAAAKRLREHYDSDPRVRVLGFTDRMPEILSAADILVHSTCGVTYMEARCCDCPVVAYGSTAGHLRSNNHMMGAYGLVQVADNTDELTVVLRRVLAGEFSQRPVTYEQNLPSAAELILSGELPGRLPSRWRRLVARSNVSQRRRERTAA